MMTRMHRLWTERRWLLLAFLAAILLTGVFAVRTVTSTLYWMDSAHRDQPIEGWMTPRYVSMSYDLPPEVVGLALSLPPPGSPGAMPRRTLQQIADDQSVTLEQLQTRIDMAVADWRARPSGQP